MYDENLTLPAFSNILFEFVISMRHLVLRSISSFIYGVAYAAQKFQKRRIWSGEKKASMKSLSVKLYANSYLKIDVYLHETDAFRTLNPLTTQNTTIFTLCSFIFLESLDNELQRFDTWKINIGWHFTSRHRYIHKSHQTDCVSSLHCK